MSAIEVNTGGKITYYKVQEKTGLLYLSSKTQLEGYEKRTYLDNDKVEKVTYHKYFKAIKGNVNYLAIKDTDYGKNLIIGVDNDGEKSAISMPLYDSYKNYSKSVEALLSVLPNVDFSKKVILGFNSSEKEGKNGKSYLNVFCNIGYPDEPNKEGYPTKVAGIDYTTIPLVTVTENNRGEKEFDKEARKDFFYEIMDAAIKKVDNLSPSTAPTVTQSESVESSVENNTQAFETVEDDDDLPF